MTAAQRPRRGRPRASRRAAAALRYAALGWPVLPLHTPTPGGCSCANPACVKPGKHPRSRHGLRDATTTPARIAAWWRTWPDANVGVATGRIVVIDVDGPHGHAALAALQATHRRLPATLTATTGRGTHLYFTAGHQPIANSAGRLGPGLDVRGHGGYVIAPPSRHADGHRYRWNAWRPPASLPAWLATLLTAAQRTPPRSPDRPAARERRARYFHAALHAELHDVASALPGTRNDTLNRAAFRLAQLAATGHGNRDALPEQLLAAATAAGLSQAEALRTIHSALHAGEQHPRPTPLAR